MPGHTGPYNDLENQVKFDPKTGEIFQINELPSGPTDAASMAHDIQYSVCQNTETGKNIKKCKHKKKKKKNR